MNSNQSIRPLFTLVAGSVLAATALMSVSSISLASDDAGYRQYRCKVLGDSTTCPAPAAMPATRIEVQTVAGPYARYLMHLGHDAGSAIEAARAAGEVQVRRTVRIVQRELSSVEAHHRHLGNLETPATGHEILGETTVVSRD